MLACFTSAASVDERGRRPAVPSAVDPRHAVGYSFEQDRRSHTSGEVQEKLRDVFDSLDDNGDSLLSKPEFETAMLEGLKLDLSKEELNRVWKSILRELEPLSEGSELGSDAARQITFEGFRHGVENVAFLRHMVTSLAHQDKHTMQVPADYDYSKPTCENYRAPTGDTSFYGQYQAIRATRDYEYHSHYTRERQLWQDGAIESVVSRTEPQPRPWIVYTCGPMGAGKGYVLGWMSRSGYFPLENIVHVDPDHFKRLMPEWPGYTARSDRAGNFCHRESGYLQEIAQEVAMQNSQNVWVDGSLRDGPWFEKVFREVRLRFPHYQIAIFEVGASEAVVRERIAKRAKETGRSVPEHLIKASLASVASSLEILTPLCDFVARINNDKETPQLRAYIRVDSQGNWGEVSSQFARPASDAAFPNSLPPLAFVECPAVGSCGQPLLTLCGRPADGQTIRLNLQHEELEPVLPALLSARAGGTARPVSAHGSRWRSITRRVVSRARGARGANPSERPATSPCGSQAQFIELMLSPQCVITQSTESRPYRDEIPPEAESYCFVYPAAVEWSHVPRPVPTSPAALLPLTGGFVYFDSHGGVCKIFAVSVHQPHEHAVYGTRTRSNTPSVESTEITLTTTEPAQATEPAEASETSSCISFGAAASAALFTVAAGSATLIRPAARVLQFEAPLPLPRAAQRALGDRLRPVTLAALLERGARRFAFITPGEELPGMVAPLAGAFAYILDTTSDECDERWRAAGGCYFPVAF
eukprot:CAMPEP_0118847456 /NCGR_PEP_ID=MMETSP1162-20130426/92975_1 /TAXON_ID=33656 /ORGANISM="Phaeocystis Sp, Strain CCMP2710" /LENGTH=759 /DNA_ID=CAMNT_0006779647 /DNA_START=476 /DNA_END=2755 /DNA_ORIENTATION=-